MARLTTQKKDPPKAIMFGMAFDNDGHKRVTTGENFALVGGSEETHGAMTEKAIKINEQLAERGKRIEDCTEKEFDDIAQSVGLERHHPENN